MDYLWSPWRMQYINDKENTPNCVFCYALSQNADQEHLILARGSQAFVMLNLYPYTSGHMLVLPYQHVPSYEELDVACRTEIMELLTRATGVLRAVYQPNGFNIGVNIGEDAGAGIAQHLHFHIVPRWRGDSNFMSVTAQTRVLPEDLKESYRRLKEAWRNAS